MYRNQLSPASKSKTASRFWTTSVALIGSALFGGYILSSCFAGNTQPSTLPSTTTTSRPDRSSDVDAFPVYEKPIPTIDETAAYQVYLDFGATQQAEYATSESAMNVHMATLEFEGWLSLGFVPTIEPLDMAETRVAEAPEESQKYLWIAATSEAEMIDAVATYYYLMTPTPPSASFVKEDDQVSTDIGGSTKSSTLVGCPTGGCVEYPVLCEHVIKGNIAFESREKIYHLPGQAFYEATVISPEFGERWFCTEDEARAAGWRKSFE